MESFSSFTVAAYAIAGLRAEDCMLYTTFRD